MNIERLSHQQLRSKIETELHTNLYEHRENIVRFLVVFLICGFLGLLLGGIFDYTINKFEGTETNRLKCAGWLTIQLLITGTSFYLAITLKRTGIPFDEWMMNTFAGFIFALSLFTVQHKFNENMQCLLPTI